MQPEHVIKRPIYLTEKGNDLREADNKYLFEVDKNATKNDIRNAVEALFKVNVTSVNTLIMRGKVKRFGRMRNKKPNWKKAIVTLESSDTIDFFDGV